MIEISITTQFKLFLTKDKSRWYLKCEPMNISNYLLISRTDRDAKIEALNYVKNMMNGIITDAKKYVDVY